jgi:2-polyprenyl-3-methyl-5-hydroxy-6-metoxy-1,4-benzoquinol methylase
VNPEKCGFCGSGEARTKYDFGSHRIVKCSSCGLMRLSPMPSLEDTKRVYSDLSYFQNAEFYDLSHGNLYGYVDYIAERVNKLRDYRPIAEFLRDRHGRTHRGVSGPPARLRLLDVGCGLGYFLDAAQDVGFDVAGVEFNPGAVRAMREKYAFKVYEGGLDAVPASEAPFDVMTMFDVIEHLHDPFGDLHRIHQLLRPGGGLVITTMDSESFTSRLLGKRVEDFRRIREHIYFFSRETLTKVLESCGFRVYKIASRGHTFELSFLMERMRIINSPIFGGAKWMVEHLGMGRWRVSIDPHTKMIVYAQKALENG